MNRTHSVIACPVDVGAEIMEELNHRCVAVISCYTGRSCSNLRLWLIKVRPHLVQQPNDLKVTLLRRQIGRCLLPARVDEI